MSRILRYFFLGVLAVLPLVLIVNIVIFIRELIGHLFTLIAGYSDNLVVTLLILLLSIATLISIGYSINTYGKSIIITGIDYLIDRLPFLGSINRITKKVVGMFSTKNNDQERQVVYLEYPRKGIWVAGYVTNRQGDMAIVFVPTSPNPTSGFTVLIPEQDLVKSGLKIEQMTSFVMSVGAEFPDAEEEVKRLEEKRSG